MRDPRALPSPSKTKERPIRTRPNLPPRRWVRAEDLFRKLITILGHNPSFVAEDDIAKTEYLARREGLPAAERTRLKPGHHKLKSAKVRTPAQVEALAARGNVYRRELLEAAPTVRALLSSLELAGRLPLEERRMALAATWNAQIDGRGWHALPRLCEVCTRPIQGRRGEQLGEGNYEPATVCSKECAGCRTSKDYRLREKLKEP